MMAHDLVDYEPYFLNWYDSNYGDGRLHGERLSNTQEGPYDDPYYLAYEEDDDYTKETEAPQGGSGSWLGDYTSYFGSYWRENVIHSDEWYGEDESSLEKEESPLSLSLFEGDKYGSYYSYNDNVQPDYSENQWPGYHGLGLRGENDDYLDDLKNQDLPYNSSWDEWDETGFYDRIFSH